MRAPFTRWRGIAAPLRWADVNTDDIFPAAAASPVARMHGAAVLGDPARVGENAFAAFRYLADGTLNPDFILNRPPYDRATILVAGPNFGCGSSRESAVWALAGIGVRCIVAPSFGEIFRNNCYQNGLLPVVVSEPEAEHCLASAESAPDAEFEIDLELCTVIAPDGRRIAFAIGDYHRNALLLGLDEIDATMSRLATIEQHEAIYWRERPWLRP